MILMVTGTDVPHEIHAALFQVDEHGASAAGKY